MNDFMIPVAVRDEAALYDAFDPSGLSLSAELKEYLEDYTEDRRLGEQVCIALHATGGVDTERFRKAYLLHLQKLTQRNKREIAKCNFSALRLLLIGIVFIVIGIVFAARMNEVVAAIISTIGSFSVWEASANWIEALPAMRGRDRVLHILTRAEIRSVREEET